MNFVTNFLKKTQQSFTSIFRKQRFNSKKSNNIPKPLHNYSNRFNSTKTRLEKIKLEKRKRNQAYKAMNYILSMNSYFDFLSADSFQILSDSKYFAQIVNKKVVDTEFLLLSFLYNDEPIQNFLKKYDITKEKLQKHISGKILIEKETKIENKEKNDFSIFKKFVEKLNTYNPFFIENIQPDLDIRYSKEVELLFEKAAENALNRFKTPVISSEVLFITLMEEKESDAGKFLQIFFTEEINWFIFRYKLIKKLHKQETDLRNQIIKNQHYFAYLLKLNLSEKEFQDLSEKQSLPIAVSIFRNELIDQILNFNIYQVLKQDISISIKISENEKILFRNEIDNEFPIDQEEVFEEIENRTNEPIFDRMGLNRRA